MGKVLQFKGRVIVPKPAKTEEEILAEDIAKSLYEGLTQREINAIKRQLESEIESGEE